ncbi:hypothetical protein D1007_47757 [Hordeum vulgare]|nr:hypothetical protein D1007_47757 [Hordeum vulgare]
MTKPSIVVAISDSTPLPSPPTLFPSPPSPSSPPSLRLHRRRQGPTSPVVSTAAIISVDVFFAAIPSPWSPRPPQRPRRDLRLHRRRQGPASPSSPSRWTALATAYQMETEERATLCLDNDHDEIMVYYRLADSDDDGPLTPHYDTDSAHRNVELAS